jgi:large subunit ribosomal protein L7/L12
MRPSLLLQFSRRRLRPLLTHRNGQHQPCRRVETIMDGVASDPPLGRNRRRPLLTTAASFHSTPALWEETTLADAPNVSRGSDEEVVPAANTPEPERTDPNSIRYAFTPPPPLSEASKLKVKNIFGKFIWLDMIEVHLLNELVQEKMGMKRSEGGGSDGVSMAKSEASAEEVPVEKQLKDIKLVGYDPAAKIKVIKEVRAIGGLGLKEAKELVESAPKIFQKGLKLDRAEELKAQLEAVGAQVEII